MSKAKPQIEWRNRIVSNGEQPANQFLAHEANARRHPAKQREALRGSLDELGWVAPVIVSKRSGKVLDGHARVEEALSKDENSPIPFVEVDVSESEEKLILASFDTVTLLAEYDREALDSLLQSVNSDNAAVQEMLSDLYETTNNYLFRDATDDRREQIANGKANKIHVILSIPDLTIFERALALTGEVNRGEAMMEIIAGFLQSKGFADAF